MIVIGWVDKIYEKNEIKDCCKYWLSQIRDLEIVAIFYNKIQILEVPGTEGKKVTKETYSN